MVWVERNLYFGRPAPWLVYSWRVWVIVEGCKSRVIYSLDLRPSSSICLLMLCHSAAWVWQRTGAQFGGVAKERQTEGLVDFPMKLPKLPRILHAFLLCLLCRHICRRVSSIWAINICMYVCMYVYEDSNSGFFRLPNVYVYAHKWLEHQLLGQSLPVSNFTVCY